MGIFSIHCGKLLPFETRHDSPRVPSERVRANVRDTFMYKMFASARYFAAETTFLRDRSINGDIMLRTHVILH